MQSKAFTTRYQNHPELLILEEDGRMLLLSVGTSSVFEIDPLIRDVLEALSTGKSDREVITALSGLYSRADVLEALEEIKALKNTRCFNLLVFPDSPPRDTCELVLSAFQGCNLRCTYCYANGRMPNHKATNRAMDFEVAQKAIDYMIEKYAPDARHLIVNFTADGETLLNFKLFKQVEQYCRTLEQRDGRLIRCGFVTNGIMLTDEVMDYLRESGREISFSIDGPPEVHNRMRHFPDGRGSYEAIMPNIERYRQRTGNPLRAAVVLTAFHTDFRGILTHLVELGFRRISMKPVRAEHGKPYALRWETLDAFKEGYSQLAEFLVTQALGGNLRFLEAIANYSDFLGRFLMRLLFSMRLLYRCRAPYAMLAVGTDGAIYPCQEFLGIPQWKIGDVFRGVDVEKQYRLSSLRIDRRESCQGCWARYICGGGCYAAAWLANGDVSKPDQVKCELVRHLILLSMQMIGTFQEQKPEVLPHLREVFLKGPSKSKS